MTALEEAINVSELLHKRLADHDARRVLVQEELAAKVAALREELNILEDRINSTLQSAYVAEEERLQRVASRIGTLLAENDGCEERLLAAASEGRAALLVEQTYTLEEHSKTAVLSKLLTLRVGEEFCGGCALLEDRRPEGVTLGAARGRITVEFSFFNPEELKEIGKGGVGRAVTYRVEMKDSENKGNEEMFLLKGDDREFIGNGLRAGTCYDVRVRGEWGEGKVSKWSETVQFTAEYLGCCAWKECPKNVCSSNEYSVDSKTHRIATRRDTANDDDVYSHYDYYSVSRSTTIGNVSLPPNQVTSWGIRMVRSWNRNGYGIWAGVAPSDISQNEDYNYSKCGWYFYLRDLALYSGPPHNYVKKKYFEWKRVGHMLTGELVGVVMDTTKGELSFVVDGVNPGVAFDGIPLDKPLVPCVIMETNEDSVELVF